jgi:hypothetical protein
LFHVASTTAAGTDLQVRVARHGGELRTARKLERCAQLNASPTVRPTTSAPWLRRISASALPEVGEQGCLLGVSSTTPM